MFNPNYLPDRLDVSPNGQQSIFYYEWLEGQKRANNFSFISKVAKLIIKKGA
tara:strand:- start:353 stop:508 length:156 start_codon:yes stop_codon:yes gene_type:complete